MWQSVCWMAFVLSKIDVQNYFANEKTINLIVNVKSL